MSLSIMMIVKRKVNMNMLTRLNILLEMYDDIATIADKNRKMLNDKIEKTESKLPSLEGKKSILEYMVIDNSYTKNKCGTNLLNHNLEAQILEIEAQLKVKSSHITDLEAMMNKKFNNLKTIWNNKRKDMEGHMKRKKQASTENLLSKVKS